MRPRRFIGVLERRLLGAAMSAILFVIERKLSRRNTGAARTGQPAEDEECLSPESVNGPGAT
jgi:hypothetical protein